MSIVKPKTALISLSDKTNIITIVEFLEEKKIKILSKKCHTFSAIIGQRNS